MPRIGMLRPENEEFKASRNYEVQKKALKPGWVAAAAKCLPQMAMSL